MKKLQYSTTIQAPAQTVWEVMTGEQTYPQWTDVFNESGGSFFRGSWEQGQKIVFVGPDEDGQEGGMVGFIAEARPYEFISIEYTGELVDGVEDTTSDDAKQWQGTHENYTLHEEGGATTLNVELDAADEHVASFDESWPKALTTLKQLAEART